MRTKSKVQSLKSKVRRPEAELRGQKTVQPPPASRSTLRAEGRQGYGGREVEGRQNRRPAAVDYLASGFWALGLRWRCW